MARDILPLGWVREPMSAASHFLAFVAACYATCLFWRLCRSDPEKRPALLCFGLSMIVLYAASATYHGLSLRPRPLRFFQLLDQSAIFILIAGTYTPPLVILLRRGPERLLTLAGIWMCAAAGIACKWVFPGAPYWLTVGLYVALGWSGLLIIGRLYQAVGLRPLGWAVAGGLFYTMGGLSDLLEWPNPWPGVFGHHEVLHVCAMAGTASHCLFMIRCVVPFAGHADLPLAAAADAELVPLD